MNLLDMSFFGSVSESIIYVMSLKRNIRVILKKENRNGKPILENLQIRLRISFPGNRVDVYTGYRLDTKDWDEKKK